MKLGWRPNTITTGVWLLFTVAAVGVIVFVAGLFWNILLSREIAAQVRQANAFSDEIRLMSENLLDAETGQRGYLLTGLQVYLEPYIAGRDDLKRRSETVRNLIVDPSLRPSLDYLLIVIAAKLGELQESIDILKSGNSAGAVALVRSDRGLRLMGEFRRVRSGILTKQSAFVTEKRNAYLSAIDNTLWIASATGLVEVVLLLLTARRTSARLRQPIDELLGGIRTVAEGNLEHRVEVSARDEIGKLADAFNAMAAQALEARRARDAVQAELERSNSELDGFAYVASHDLKAPLRGIRKLAEWIAEDAGMASADTKQNLELLRKRVDRLDSLLESLLEYARVGRSEDIVGEVNTKKLVSDIADYLAPKAGFSVVVDGSLPTITTARPPLEKVLRNLIGNALKHHDGDYGVVTVSAALRGSMAEFRVADDGPGIPAAFHDKVFQMFQTLKPRDEVEGSGMGLAIVKKTVENFGGTIHIESDPPARGTAFVFTWPTTSARTIP